MEKYVDESRRGHRVPQRDDCTGLSQRATKGSSPRSEACPRPKRRQWLDALAFPRGTYEKTLQVLQGSSSPSQGSKQIQGYLSAPLFKSSSKRLGMPE
jgi:hypothetical protein